MELIDPDAYTAPDEQLTNHFRAAEYTDQYFDCEGSSSDSFADVKTATFLSRFGFVVKELSVFSV
jgi:hypothetical protein